MITPRALAEIAIAQAVISLSNATIPKNHGNSMLPKVKAAIRTASIAIFQDFTGWQHLAVTMNEIAARTTVARVLIWAVEKPK